MSVNEHLSELERDLEEDLREAQQLLVLSWEEVLCELRSRRASLGAAAERGLQDLEALAGEADSRLRELRARLGELNLLLAEEEIRDLYMFQKYRERVLQAMEAAKEALDKLKAEGSAGWSDRGDEMDGVWKRYFQTLELVRIRLDHESQMALERFEGERLQLIDELEKLRADPPKTWNRQDLVEEISGRFRAFVPYLQALLLWPDVVAPKPPDERGE